MFCDEDGFDVIPAQMVNVINIQEENSPIQESLRDHTIEIELNHVKLDNEVSTFDLSFEHETQGENYYHASDELEDVDLQETQAKVDNPIIFKTSEGKEIELPHYPHPKQRQERDKSKKKLKENNPKPKMAPTIQGNQEYLKMVKAKDCQKNRVTNCYIAKPVKNTKSN